MRSISQEELRDPLASPEAWRSPSMVCDGAEVHPLRRGKVVDAVTDDVRLKLSMAAFARADEALRLRSDVVTLAEGIKPLQVSCVLPHPLELSGADEL